MCEVFSLGVVVYWRKAKELSGQAHKGMAVREHSYADFVKRAVDAAGGIYLLHTGQVGLTGTGPERLFIRDFGGWHGNTLNGLCLSGKDHTVTAPLNS